MAEDPGQSPPGPHEKRSGVKRKNSSTGKPDVTCYLSSEGLMIFPFWEKCFSKKCICFSLNDKNGGVGKDKTFKQNSKSFLNIFVDFFVNLRIINTCMDRKNDCKIPYCGEVPDLEGRKVVVGAKQLKKAILGGAARQVFLAENADPAITEPLEQLCRQYAIPYSRVCSMSELGRACRIEVGAAAAAVVD